MLLACYNKTTDETMIVMEIFASVYLLHLGVCPIRHVDATQKDHCRYARIAEEVEESVDELLLGRLPEVMNGVKYHSTRRPTTLSTGERCWITATLPFASPNTARIRLVWTLSRQVA